MRVYSFAPNMEITPEEEMEMRQAYCGGRVYPLYGWQPANFSAQLIKVYPFLSGGGISNRSEEWWWRHYFKDRVLDELWVIANAAQFYPIAHAVGRM